jgi:hypothetical protein
MKLFRSVGEKEFRIIQQRGFKSFPARLPGQPVFHPVLNKQYAMELAAKHNAADISSYRNYVLEFEVDDDYISWFDVETKGAEYRQEYDIPAEQLDEFNSHINGLISVVGVYNKAN